MKHHYSQCHYSGRIPISEPSRWQPHLHTNIQDLFSLPNTVMGGFLDDLMELLPPLPAMNSLAGRHLNLFTKTESPFLFWKTEAGCPKTAFPQPVDLRCLEGLQ